jgi:hypothetical protein
MEEISGDYLADERMARRGTADGFDFPPTAYRSRAVHLQPLYLCDPNLSGLGWLEPDLERGGAK